MVIAVAVYGLSRQSVAPNVASAGVSAPPPSATPIQHVIFIMKENRSFDEYFGQFPGANGSTTGVLSNGQTIPLGTTPDPMPQDIGHGYADWLAAWDGGKMDGFANEKDATTPSGTDLAYTQMSQSEIPNYWRYALTYTLADNTFSDARGASFGNNMFEFAAQDGQYDSSIGNRALYDITASATAPTQTSPWGCDSPPDALELMLAPDGSKSLAFPCFGFASLPNELANTGMTWGVYRPNRSSPHDALDALRQVRYNPSLWSHNYPTSALNTAATQGTLPQVAWYLPTQVEHAPQSACAGENDTVRLVNAVMKGPQWSSTAIVIAWDDWGGYYDHVAPPVVDGVRYGFRVPMIVISPYTAPGPSADGGSIDHTFYSFASILKMIEDNWHLPALTPADANANSLLGTFDFTAPPRPPTILSTRTCSPLTATERTAVAQEPPD